MTRWKVRQAAQSLIDALRERYPDETFVGIEVHGQYGKLHHTKVSFPDLVMGKKVA